MDNEDKGPTQQSERRAWLKKRGAERKLMKREMEFMAKEDELAHEVRRACAVFALPAPSTAAPAAASSHRPSD